MSLYPNIPLNAQYRNTPVVYETTNVDTYNTIQDGQGIKIENLTTGGYVEVSPSGIELTNDGINIYNVNLYDIIPLETPPNATTLEVNNKVALDDQLGNVGSIGINGLNTEITATGDLLLNPTGSIDANGKTLNMTAGEIHNCPLIHSQNNNSLTLESKGTGDLVLKTNNLNRLVISDTGDWTIAGGVGSSGQVLTSNGVNASPSWTTPSSGGASVETIAGTTPISPTINITLLGGTNHSLASGSTIGFEKTIVKNTDNVFSPIITPTTFDPTFGTGGFQLVNVLKYDSIGNRMYIGGLWFAGIGTDYFNNFCYYDFATGLFNKADQGVGGGGEVRTIALDIANDRVYIGGTFNQLGSTGIPSLNVGIYVPSTNTYLTWGITGANSYCNKLLLYNGYVYAVGDFTAIDGVANTRGVARWNIATSTWEAMGQGVVGGSTFIATCITRDGNDIWIGGTFTSVKDSAGVNVANTNRLAKWDTTTNTWSGYGNSFGSSSVSALATLAPNEIFVGGNFTQLQSPTLYYAYSVKLNTSTLTFSQYGYTNSNASNNNTFIDNDGTLWLFNNAGGLSPPVIQTPVSTDAITTLGVYPPYFYDTSANKWTGLLGQGTINQLICMEMTGVAGEYWIGAGNQQIAIDAGNLATFGGILKFDKTKLEKITCSNLILNGQTARTRFHLIWKGQSVKLMNLDNTNWVVMNTSSVNANGSGFISNGQGGQGQVFFY